MTVRDSDQKFLIRALEPGDFDAWLMLWRGYLTFYGADLAEDATKTTWDRFFDDEEPVYGFAAFQSNVMVGIVHAISHRATWTQGHYLYLEDLFTASEVRGQGIGKALIDRVYRLADHMDAARVYWHTHETNGAARALYDRVGHNAGFIQYRRPA
ncbi:MAG: GNAT family N-acetyltransferase [Pseudomonadota bacterium]